MSTRDIGEIISALDYSGLESGVGKLLGMSHWYISKAKTELHNLCWEKDGDGIFTKQTPFSSEVGSKQVTWWIRKKEDNILELLDRTKDVLVSLNKLKESVRAVQRNFTFSSYPNLVNQLVEFTNTNKLDIEKFYEYTKWLYSKNSLAPSILHQYPVWSGSRISNNLIPTKGNSIEDDVTTVNACIKIVLGLGIKGTLTPNRIIFDDFFGEDIPTIDFTNVDIQEQIFQRAANQTLMDFSAYFEIMRNNVELIIQEIDDFFEEELHHYDNSFWESFIKKAMDDRNSEREIWDFKETLSMWRVSGQQEVNNAQIDFAENVTCYANSEGGVMVIGITNSPRTIVGLTDREDKLKTIPPVLKAKTDYQNDFFNVIPVNLKDETNAIRECIVVLISQTNEPVGVERDHSFSYPIRNQTECIKSTRHQIVTNKKNIVSDNYEFIKKMQQFLN